MSTETRGRRDTVMNRVLRVFVEHGGSSAYTQIEFMLSKGKKPELQVHATQVASQSSNSLDTTLDEDSARALMFMLAEQFGTPQVIPDRRRLRPEPPPLKNTRTPKRRGKPLPVGRKK